MLGQTSAGFHQPLLQPGERLDGIVAGLDVRSRLVLPLGAFEFQDRLQRDFADTGLAGDTAQFTCHDCPTDRNDLNWPADITPVATRSCDNVAVATVNSTGPATAVARGQRHYHRDADRRTIP